MYMTMTKNLSPVPASAKDVKDIPLNQLVLDAENVRKTPSDKAAQAELVASIRSHGLLENLVVRPAEPDSDGTPRYSVIAGGRRLAALVTIASDDASDETMPVSCKVVSAENSRELSLAENTARLAMHPADQIEAFGKLFDDGASVATIAARFGVSEHFIEQRLRLAGVLPEILKSYREGKCRMDVVKAFALTTDQERQKQVWKKISKQRWEPQAHEVTRMLTNERVHSGMPIARFVGVEDYQAAGGIVMRDLFSEDGRDVYWFEDPGLLNDLANKKLGEIADEQAKKWKWATSILELPWNATSGYGRIEPQPGEPTDKEEQELKKIEDRLQEMDAIDAADWTSKLGREAERLEKRVETIEARIEKRRKFRKEDCAISGCIVTIDRDGSPGVIGGLVRPEDIPKPKGSKSNGANGTPDAGVSSDGDSQDSDIVPPRSSMSTGKDPRTQARSDAGVTMALAEDLQAIRTTTVKVHLAEDFDAAFDLVLFQAARAIFHRGWSSRGSLDISFTRTPTRPMIRTNDENFADWNPAEDTLSDWSGLPLGWMEEKDDAARFAGLCTLPRPEKERLFAAAIAHTLTGQLAFEYHARPEFEATVARLDIDFAKETRPSAALLWSRVSKGKMLEIAESTIGENWASTRSSLKKGVLAESMEQAFSAGDTPSGLSAEEHARAQAWTMPGFAAFDGLQDADAPPAEAEGDAAVQEEPGEELPDFLGEAD